MRKRHALKHLHQSVEAVARGDFEQARIEAERAIFFDNGNADAFTVQGVALAKLVQPELASTAFKKALELHPLVPRHAYNIGVHLYAQGDHWEARKAASQALKDDPEFQAATDLIALIDENRFDESPPYIIPEVFAPVIEAPAGGKSHTLAFMSGMESQWTLIGWIFVALSLLAGIGMWIYQPIQPPLQSAGKTAPFVLRQDVGSIVTIFLLVISAVFSMIWMLADIVDRKAKMVWLVPTVACCTCGMHVVPHALYMLMRRD